jgi:hypothetical protein
VDDLGGDAFGVQLLQPPGDVERTELSAGTGGVAGTCPSPETIVSFATMVSFPSLAGGDSSKP